MPALLLAPQGADDTADYLWGRRDLLAHNFLVVHSVDARHCRHGDCDRDHCSRRALVAGCGLVGIRGLVADQSAFPPLGVPQRAAALAGQSEAEAAARRAGAAVGVFDKQLASAPKEARSDLAVLRNHHPLRQYQPQSHFDGVENLARLVVVRRQLNENNAQHVGANFPP